MIACICGFSAPTEDELASHFIECHRQSYGLEACSSEVASEGAESGEIRPAA